MSITTIILNFLNNLSIFVSIVSLAFLILSLLENFRILSYTKIRGPGLPKVAIGLFFTTFALIFSTLAIILILFGYKDYLGLACFLAFLAIVAFSYSTRKLRKAISSLLYG